ncbi:MAG: NAD(P)H-dependent glycerol-3-phosphate dehydrogenase, partial [Proteobacteria bacterium]|nr:NAD(P)H-dependent glycerol-3-phosphate dehydrogenase [Pseudomonadota bacterium]
MQLRVSVLGAGSFGTTIAHLATRNAPTLLWCRRAETAEEVNAQHR